MMPEILKKVSHIDILYCNAGTYIGGDLDSTDAATIDSMLNLNGQHTGAGAHRRGI
jgi:ribitol 2-dehydrogenase